MRRSVALAAITVGLWAAAATAAHLPPFDQARVYSASAFQAAVRPYEEAIRRNANDAEAHFWLGVAYLYAARLRRLGLVTYGADFLSRAVQALERAVSLRPTPQALAALAEAYTTAGEQEKATAALQRLATVVRPAPPGR